MEERELEEAMDNVETILSEQNDQRNVQNDSTFRTKLIKWGQFLVAFPTPSY